MGVNMKLVSLTVIYAATWASPQFNQWGNSTEGGMNTTTTTTRTTTSTTSSDGHNTHDRTNAYDYSGHYDNSKGYGSGKDFYTHYEGDEMRPREEKPKFDMDEWMESFMKHINLTETTINLYNTINYHNNKNVGGMKFGNGEYGEKDDHSGSEDTSKGGKGNGKGTGKGNSKVSKK